MGSPKYIKIRNTILDDIRTGKLKEGDQLPTREEMLSQYSVTRTTIDKAISDLNQRKILKSITKRGTFVTGEPVAIKVAVIFNTELISSIDQRYLMQDLGLLYYAMLIHSRGIDYQFLDVNQVLSNLRLLSDFEFAVWVQPSTRILEQMEKVEIPCIVINRKVPGYYCISTDHKKSAFEVTDYYVSNLKEKGLQVFYLYSSKSIKIIGKTLLEGFVEACAKHNLFYRILDLDGGHYTVTRELLAQQIKFDIPVFILASPDKYTGAVLKLAQANQVEFGKELFFCDYDNPQSLDKNGVEFSSIVQDYFEMGRILSENINRLGKDPLHIDVPYKITGLTKFDKSTT